MMLYSFKLVQTTLHYLHAATLFLNLAPLGIDFILNPFDQVHVLRKSFEFKRQSGTESSQLNSHHIHSSLGSN
jgi:hypothetical protein